MIALVLILPLIGLLLWRLLFADIRRGIVGWITDGDTFKLEDGTCVRLLSIDAPEMGQHPHGPIARVVLQQMLPPGTPVHLRLGTRRSDRYNRLLAYAYTPDGECVNVEMARQGYALAHVYRENSGPMGWKIQCAALEARLARRGLWANSGFRVRPWTYRERQNSWLARLLGWN